ncbi:MAG: preprotein translocase subunit SecE [Puniceicoccales bacterium]|jgi:preprotein translocase subunit SecE|nr:preprotein translocase subunit SecE [Puniceicoccales bacterium]
MTNPFTKIKKFFAEIVVELKKSSWPTKKSLKQSTVIVIVAMFLFGAYISVIDFSLFHTIKLINLVIK